TVADIENRAVPAFLWMACSGVFFDASAWDSLANESEACERRLIEQLDSQAPAREGCFGMGAWNWNSWRDVIEVFTQLGFKLDSTKDAALATIDHPLAVLLREHRSAAQRVKTFGRSWLEHVYDGRMYAHWNQL